MAAPTFADIQRTLGLKLTDTSGAPPVDQTTLNQEYKKQVDDGKFKGSFANFMQHLDVNKALTSGSDLINNVRNLFGKNTTPVDYTGPAPSGPGTGMSSVVRNILIFGGIAVVAIVIVVIVKHAKKGK